MCSLSSFVLWLGYSAVDDRRHYRHQRAAALGDYLQLFGGAQLPWRRSGCVKRLSQLAYSGQMDLGIAARRDVGRRLRRVGMVPVLLEAHEL